jgi:transcriptional regulator GlxA family with amidase domain
MVLSTAGLLDGRPVATHTVAEDDLRAAGADLQTARAVDAGDVLTSGGVTWGLDLAFHVVRHEFGGGSRTASRGRWSTSRPVPSTWPENGRSPGGKGT